ncbi:MAG: hypothetical protein Q8P81_02120 [Nanoarchaeota archaeon]|nr:hypothetical protein [Nanoarchaeota archaeon]
MSKKEIKESQEIVPMVIDLGIARRGDLNENSLGQFGAQIDFMLNSMFRGGLPSGLVRGTEREIDSFMQALNNEKGYISDYQKYGLNDPNTYSSRYRLESAIKNFERATGIKWPIK